MILTRELVEHWNERARARGAELSPIDKAALASLLLVSVRTVQRWFAPLGGQYRRLIPLSVEGKDFTALDVRMRLRVVLGAMLAGEHTRFCGRGVELKREILNWRTIADALTFADALAEGMAPVWLTCNWRRETVARAGLLWEQSIIYEGERAEKARGIALGYRAEEEQQQATEGEPAPCNPDEDCPGDDLRRACCWLKTPEECCHARR
jgi:hypothetical protein